MPANAGISLDIGDLFSGCNDVLHIKLAHRHASKRFYHFSSRVLIRKPRNMPEGRRKKAMPLPLTRQGPLAPGSHNLRIEKGPAFKLFQQHEGRALFNS
jgi:hypothetical protein